LSRGLTRYTPALFAVLDDKTPSGWRPWGTRAISDVSDEIRVVYPQSLTVGGADETFTPALVAEPEAELLGLDNWTAIVGAVVDATRLPRPHIRALHQEVCARVAASRNPLSKRVGYYLVFCVGRHRLTDQHHAFFEALKSDAESRLNLARPKGAATARVSSDGALKSALNAFVDQMRSAAAVE